MKLVLGGVLSSAGVARAILQLGEVRFAFLEVMLCSNQSFLSLRDGEILVKNGQLKLERSSTSPSALRTHDGAEPGDRDVRERHPPRLRVLDGAHARWASRNAGDLGARGQRKQARRSIDRLTLLVLGLGKS